MDTVIANMLVLDHAGLDKADMGLRDATSPPSARPATRTRSRASPSSSTLGTEIVAGEGKIPAAGGFVSHLRFICQPQVEDALHSGINTMPGGGTGPGMARWRHLNVRTPTHRAHVASRRCVPISSALAGKADARRPEALAAIIAAGACALKLHGDWGTKPSAIDRCPTVAEPTDVQAMIPADTLNESGFVENTLAAIRGRTLHAFHIEGAGGGHAPDILKVVSMQDGIRRPPIRRCPAPSTRSRNTSTC